MTREEKTWGSQARTHSQDADTGTAASIPLLSCKKHITVQLPEGNSKYLPVPEMKQISAFTDLRSQYLQTFFFLSINIAICNPKIKRDFFSNLNTRTKHKKFNNSLILTIIQSVFKFPIVS